MLYRNPLTVWLLLLLLLGACSDKAKKPTTPTPKADTTAMKGTPLDTSTTLPTTSETSAGFEGDWSWTNDKDIFTLSLDREGSRITGHHEAYTQDGRADVSTDDDISSINGTINGNEASVTFRSTTSGVTGKATLRLQGGKLLWEITSATAGDLFIPRKATLVRDEEPNDDTGDIHDESSGDDDDGSISQPEAQTPKPQKPLKGSKAPKESKADTSK